MAVSCTPGSTVIEWSLIHNLAVLIDDVADTLNTPNYSRLVLIDNMPFDKPSTVPFAGAVHFALNPGTTQVTDQYLVSSLTSTVPYTLDAKLEEMAYQDDLFLLHTADGCWCNTLFKVEMIGGAPALKEVSGTLGCCQTLPVPQIGDSLDAGQNFIPSGKAAYFAALGAKLPLDFGTWLYRNACHGHSGGVGFQFAGVERGDDLIAASRTVAGKFVWPIRKAHMDEIFERLCHITRCQNNGGARNGEIVSHVEIIEEEPYEVSTIDRCDPFLSDILMMLEAHSDIASDPGCHQEGLTWNTNSNDAADFNLPWLVATCGGAECGEQGLQFYCETLKQLDKIATKLPDLLYPYEGVESQGCCCTPSVEWNTQQGAAMLCAYYDPGAGAWCTRSTVLYECSNFEYVPSGCELEDPIPPECHLEVVETCEWTGWGDLSGDVINPETSACPVSSGSDGPCADYCSESELPIDQFFSNYISAPTPAGLQAAAESNLYTTGLAVSGEAYFDYPVNIFNPFAGPGARVTEGDYRITMQRTDPKARGCELDNAVSVDYHRNLYYNAVLIESVPLTTSLTWNAGLGKLVSPWITPPAVALSNWDDAFYYAIVPDDESIRCPCAA